MDQKLRWGFLSTAKHGQNAYLPAITASCNGRVVAVASRDEARGRAFAEAAGIEKVHGSYESLLADPDVDVIYNPLPNGMHAEWTIRALEAGKPVLCEKPLCSNAAEAEQMAEAVERTGVLAAEAYMYRHHPLNRTARELVRDGRVGEVRQIRASFFAGASDPTNIRFQKALAGGAMRDLGGYCTSLMRFLLGEEPIGAVARGIEFEQSGVDVRMSGVVEFPGGILGSFDCGFTVPFSCNYEVIGTEGRLVVASGAMVASAKREHPIELHTATGVETISTPVANHYQLMAEAFVDAVTGAVPLEFPIADAVKNMRLLDQVRAAAGYLD